MIPTQYSRETPAGKILAHLQRHGEGSIKDLEELLGTSTTAVREHLTHLEARGLVAVRQVRNGPGRPRLVYSLSARAQELFPKEYDTLVTLLMREIAFREGPAGLQELLDAVGERLAEEYRRQISGGNLAERLSALRQVLEARGIPTEVRPESVGFQLFACPYHEVAQEHAGVCAMERQMLEQVLGERITLDGTIREGRRSCQFTLVNKAEG